MGDMITIHQHKHCSFCWKRYCMATPAADPPLRDGGFAICLQCGEWSVFSDYTDDFRKPTDVERKEILEAPVYGWMKKVGRE